MSHLTPVGVRYVDREVIERTLNMFGLPWQAGPQLLTNTRYVGDDARIEVDLLIPAIAFGPDVGVDAGFELKNGEYLLHYDAFDVDHTWRYSDLNPYKQFHSGFAESFTAQYSIEATRLQHGNRLVVDDVVNTSQGLQLRMSLKPQGRQALLV